jgi:hypothetical protein
LRAKLGLTGVCSFQGREATLWVQFPQSPYTNWVFIFSMEYYKIRRKWYEMQIFMGLVKSNSYE